MDRVTFLKVSKKEKDWYLHQEGRLYCPPMPKQPNLRLLGAPPPDPRTGFGAETQWDLGRSPNGIWGGAPTGSGAEPQRGLGRSAQLRYCGEAAGCEGTADQTGWLY